MPQMVPPSQPITCATVCPTHERTAVVRMALPATERLLYYGEHHTVKLEPAPATRRGRFLFTNLCYFLWHVENPRERIAFRLDF